MRFLISETEGQEGTATPGEMAAIDAFNDGLSERGQFILARGLFVPDSAKLLDNGKNICGITTDPLNNGSEYLSGFWMIECDCTAHSKDLALKASKNCNRKFEFNQLL